VDAPTAAAGYVLVVFASSPASGPAAHLERTARVALTGASLPAQGQRFGTCGLIEVAAALHPEATAFAFAKSTYRWGDQVGQVPYAKRLLPTGPSEGGVLAAVPGDVPVRWLAAASLLTGAELILFVPNSVQGAVAVRPRGNHKNPLALETIEELLLTQKQGPTGEGLFNAVTRDADRLKNTE
jgi:hypothetical protein